MLSPSQPSHIILRQSFGASDKQQTDEIDVPVPETFLKTSGCCNMLWQISERLRKLRLT
jgi:hypothetical protein